MFNIQETFWNGNSFGFTLGRHEDNRKQMHQLKYWD